MGMDIHCFLEEYNEKTRLWKLSDTKDFWDQRSYWTFAWLGCNFRANFIQPINLPRGLPSDISNTLKEQKDYSIQDGHSHSYFTFEELLEYFGIPVYCKSEFSQKYLDFLKREHKEIWQDIDFYLACDKGTIKETWTMPVDEIVNSEFIDLVKKESKNKNPNHLRIVFWFDN